MKTAKKTSKTAAKKKMAKKVTKKHDALIKANRAKLTLIERLQGFGLLDQGVVERLEKKAEGFVEAPGSGLEVASSWDRSLASSLGSFEATGGDGSVKRSLQALLSWQESLGGLPVGKTGLTRALAGLKKVIPFHGASLYVRNPDQESVRHLLSVGFEVQLISRIRFLEGSGFSSWVASKKKPVLYSSLHRNEAPGSEHVRSFMSVPLTVGEDCMGVLNVGHREDGAYDQASLRRLLLAAGIFAGLVQRNIAQSQIKAREIRDPATGLATFSYLRMRLEEEVVRCRELGHSMSLLLVRLHELPEYAEQFGEDFRTRCRTELAKVALDWKAPTELVGRGKGDALIVILPSARKEKAQSRADALAAALAKHNFPRRKRMTAAFGVATYPTDAEDPQELLEYVDKSLQEAAGAQNGFLRLTQAMAM